MALDTSSISLQFKNVLGRVPTQAEMDYLGKFMSEGSLGAHEIGQILQATPEYQNTQLQKNLGQYGDVLQASDTQSLQRGADIAGAQAQSRFAGLGRPGSSALAASVFGSTGQMASDLAAKRQSALASFYGQGLQTNAAMGAGQGQGLLERGYGLRDETRQRQYQIEDRNYMKQLYDEYASKQSRAQRRGALGGLVGGAGGAALGGALGNYLAPGVGGMAGARLGAGLGQSAGGLF